MTDDPRSTILPDVYPRATRTLQVTPHPYFTPDNAILTAIYRDKRTGAPSYYPVEVKRKDLLAALGAEPDETDYREVIEENTRLGRKLAEAISDRDAAERERDSVLEELRDAAEAPEEPRDDQAQIDRSWALEKAGEVVGRLAAVGVHLSDPESALRWAAEWILDAEESGRG